MKYHIVEVFMKRVMVQSLLGKALYVYVMCSKNCKSVIRPKISDRIRGVTQQFGASNGHHLFVHYHASSWSTECEDRSVSIEKNMATRHGGNILTLEK